MIAIDRERLISEKRNNRASAEGARLPKEAMLLRDIYKFTKPSLDAFRPFGIISRACQQGCESESGPFSLEAKSQKFFHLHIGYLT